jgi:Fe2+ transport system protein FeoA
MGIRPGSLLKIANIAPLGDPVEIAAFGHNLALRLSELEELILVPDRAVQQTSEN